MVITCCSKITLLVCYDARHISWEKCIVDKELFYESSQKIIYSDEIIKKVNGNRARELRFAILATPN